MKSGSLDLNSLGLPSIIISVIQPSKSGGYKNRLAFCPAMQFTVVEMIFGLSIVKLFEQKKDMDIRYGDTPEMTFQMLKLISSFYKMPLDFKSYDQTIPSFVIVACFQALKTLYKLDSYESKVFDFMVSYIINAPIYHNDIGLVPRKRGIISGSFYTNVIDSMGNCVILGIAGGKNNGLDGIRVYGDDNLLIGRHRYPDLTNIESYLSILGMSVTYDRKYFSKTFNTHFSGSFWTRNGPERDIKRMMYGCVLVKHK